ncbi:Predicted nucleic acid-binding protein, contains PIN domain [Dethiosulfatibacter aminovorans DSM 17477]|uniref:Predicted nucleic acid-binding protein, contains PIN domain n=1 Tax=Dethiosulfatibacter aminovorans DSM 17477 TaxID=1121476 RepID=A0A1M6J0L6_9FIRM|nr:PIN domain-containing protein [Dethiosulfatibacter aminovorans]SHJ40215.1 Predicted nucleic acid-binding protein, contains PIN domain [Dethiosulfatibacter aminovorans DSM 17477]
MKVIIDNNVILDVFQNRQPFVQHSSEILRLVETNHLKGFVTANSVTDIHYILNKYLKDKQKLYSIMEILLKLLDIIDVTALDVRQALYPGVTDFEDELICVCAKRARVDYIITRNKKDFTQSSVKALTPEEFLKEFYNSL